MSKHIARIPIIGDRTTGEYEYQIHNDGHSRHFNLNKDDFDILDEMLRTMVEDSNGIMIPAWKDTIHAANDFIMQHNDYKKLLIDDNIPIPDYRNLLSKVKGY